MSSFYDIAFAMQSHSRTQRCPHAKKETTLSRLKKRIRLLNRNKYKLFIFFLKARFFTKPL